MSGFLLLHNLSVECAKTMPQPDNRCYVPCARVFINFECAEKMPGPIGVDGEPLIEVMLEDILPGSLDFLKEWATHNVYSFYHELVEDGFGEDEVHTNFCMYFKP